MKNIKMFVLIFGFNILCSSFDLHENKYQIDGPYYIASDPAGSGESLWYAMDNDNSLFRLDSVKRAGHTKTFIIAETMSGYYFINKLQDSKNKSSAEVVGRPRNYNQFRRALDSLNVKDFKFDFYLSK